MACPVCKSKSFYVKDQSDQFVTHEFELLDGHLQFDENDPDSPSEVAGKQEVFCQRCAWHGPLADL